MTRGHAMKSQDGENSRAKNGVSRLWLGVAAAAGAAQTAADRTSRWRKLLSARLPGHARSQAPAQVAVPTEPGGSATAPSPSKRVERPAESAADTKQPGA